MTHFDEVTCLLYLEGQLERPRAQELAAHADRCSECRGLLRALECESRLLEQALLEEDEAVPARLLEPRGREATTPWAWIISFGLAAAGAYTLWTGIVEPWRQQMSQAGFSGGSLLTILFFRGAFWKGWSDMANTAQFLAMLTLGFLAAGLLRRTWRRWTTIAVVMSAVAALLALPPAASAAEVKKASSYVLAKGEVIKNDLVVTGESVRIDGTVEGDLITFSHKLTVNGHVTGDVIAFAQHIRIDGQVDGSVRAFSSLLAIAGSVGRGVTAFVSSCELEAQAKVGGGMMFFCSDAILAGRVGRDVMGFSGRSMLDGYIGGSATLHSGRLSIGPSAEIAGKASYQGERQPDVSPQAKLSSPLDVKIVHHRPSYTSPRYYLHQLLRYGGALVFGIVLLLLLPGFFLDVVSSSRRYGLALGTGALTLVAGLILAVIGCLLLFIGVPAGLAVVLVYVPLIYAAQIFVGTWIGEKLLGERDVRLSLGLRSTETEAILARLALGLLIIRLLGLVPYVGHLVWLVVILWGVGAMVLAVHKRTRKELAAV